MLSSQETLLIAIVAVALVLMLSNRIRPDVVAIMVMLAMGLSGLVSPQETFSGFSRNAVITIVGLFVITESLENTGVVMWLANRLRTIGGGSEVRLILLFMSAGAALSLIMNNIAAGAVLLPAALQVSRDAGVKPSRLLMPLSFGTLVGGMATYFTTANIIVSGILNDQGEAGLGMLDFLPAGGLIVVLALVYMAFVGRKLLPARESLAQTVSPLSLSRKLSEMYQLQERMWEVRVPPGSRLVHVPISHSHIGEELGVTILAIWRGHQAILTPDAAEMIEEDDVLLLLGRRERVDKLVDWGLLVGRENGSREARHDYRVDMTEVIIPPRSAAIGKTLKDLRFRNKYGLTTVALWRGGRSYRTDVGITPLEVGDALLMVGPIPRIKQLSRDRDFLVLESSHVHQPPARHKARWALLITLLVLVAAIINIFPLPEVMLLGAVAMILTGCVTMDEAYRAIEWQVIFLIAGIWPLSIALVNTGLADRVGEALIAGFGSYGPLVLIAGAFFTTVAVTQVIGGQVASLIIGPVAVAAAIQQAVNPQAMAVAVAIGCSTAFLTPMAHAVNVLMMGPGGYTTRDFLRVGLGMTLVTFLGLLLALLLIWNIH